MLNRRDFIGLTAAGTFAATKGINAGKMDFQDDAFQKSTKMSTDLDPVILPRAIKPGDTIGVTAPASPTGMWEIRNSINFIKRLGCKIKIGKTVTEWETSDRYFSADDQVRADEFMSFIKSDDIDAILCARGGYGVMRILNLLDFNEIRNNPKAIIGFSDITALLNAVYQKSRLVSYHGPVAALDFNNLTERAFRKVLFNNEKDKLPTDFKPIELKYPEAEVINSGICTGKLSGGNLSMISATLGTPYEIDTKDSIFFIEEVFEEPYKIDRMLTQLLLSGKFNECNGIIFGRFTNLDIKKPFYPGMQFTVRQILNQLVKPLNKPTIINYPIGHGEGIITLPIGVYSELNADSKILSILEQPVS